MLLRRSRRHNDEFFAYDQTYYWRVTAYTTAESRIATPTAANDGAVFSFKTMTVEEYLTRNPLDTEDLEETIIAAEALSPQIQEISEGGLYYDGTTASLEAAIADAKEVMSSLSTQDQVGVNTACARLQGKGATPKSVNVSGHITKRQGLRLCCPFLSVKFMLDSFKLHYDTIKTKNAVDGRKQKGRN